MKGTKSAVRYAQALLDLAIERKVLDRVKSDMQLVAAVIAENRELELVLQSPIIKTDRKLNVLSGIFEKSVDVLTISFMQMVVGKGREAHLPAIVGSFIELYNGHMGIVKAEVTSAVALSAAQKSAVIEQLSSLGKSIELDEKVNASLIGGLKIRVGDMRLDASLKKKLNDIKNDIHKS